MDAPRTAIYASADHIGGCVVVRHRIAAFAACFVTCFVMACLDPAFAADQALPKTASDPPRSGPAPFMPQTPCLLGASAAAGLSAQTSVNSTSAFYRGHADTAALGALGAFADCKIANVPGGKLSLVPTFDVRWNDLPFRGLGGGAPLSSSGSLTQLDYFLLLKYTRPLTPRYDISLFLGPGAATLHPHGNPGGPFFTGSDTVFALRTGIEISQLLYAGWVLALNLTYQYTAPSRYETTLPGEGYRIGGNNSIMIGLNVGCCNNPPPPGTSEATDLTPKLPPAPPPVTPKRKVAMISNSVCGPDITDKVLAVLRKMKADFDANPAKQGEACRNLVNPLEAEDAWDINGLDPSLSPQSEDDKYDPVKDRWKYHAGPWFTLASKICARPRPQCAASVEFLGTCQHAQIVNYTQWGLMTRLCGALTSLTGDMARGARNTFSVVMGSQEVFAQNTMVEFGSDYADLIAKKGYTDDDVNEIAKKVRKRSNNEIDPRPEQACKLHCEMSAADKSTFDKQVFGYKWLGIPGHNK